MDTGEVSQKNSISSRSAIERFLARVYVRALHAIAKGQSSVRPSVRLSHSWATPKPFKTSNDFTRYDRAMFIVSWGHICNPEFRGSPRTNMLNIKNLTNNLQYLENGARNLVLLTNRKSHTGFRLVGLPNRWSWMTSSGVMAVILRYYDECVTF